MKIRLGVTLLEALVSASILGLVGLSAMGIFNQSARQRYRNEVITQLTLLAHQKMEEVQFQARQKNRLPEPGEFTIQDNSNIHGNIAYLDHPYTDTLQYVEIKVTTRQDLFSEEYVLVGIIPSGNEP